MPKLHLGVIDLPYSAAPSKTMKKSASVTTGDVAEFLESKYHVMEVFYEQNKSVVAKNLEVSIKNSLESLLLGAPTTIDPFGAATGAIEHDFKQFLLQKQMDALGYPGVPTQASLEGVSHRFANKKGAPGRPSFIDTGLYQSSFKAWVA